MKLVVVSEAQNVTGPRQLHLYLLQFLVCYPFFNIPVY